MKAWLFVFIYLIVFIGNAQSDDERRKQFNLKNNLALQGYDPVSYFMTKPVEGRADITATYRGVTYRFANQENLNRFKADPEKYEPAYGGWCAYAMGETGEKVKIDPETYKIINGRVYLFYNFWTNNTLTTWNKNEKQLKEAADRNWAKFVR